MRQLKEVNMGNTYKLTSEQYDRLIESIYMMGYQQGRLDLMNEMWNQDREDAGLSLAERQIITILDKEEF